MKSSARKSRASFLASVQSSYQLYTDLLMRQHQAEPTKGFDALAVEVSERQRARSLLDLLTEAHADVRQGVDAALLERERSLGRQLNDKAQRLTQATKPEQAAALKQEISQLETDYERAQAAIRKSQPALRRAHATAAAQAQRDSSAARRRHAAARIRARRGAQLPLGDHQRFADEL